MLDDLDARIITLLQDDGRRPTVEMARHLAVAEGTVRKRIERLIREKVIQIGAWADPLKIGYQNYAVLMMHVDLRDLERAAEQLSKMPEIFFLGTCTGGFDLFVSACFRSLEHMHEFMTKRLSRVPGISASRHPIRGDEARYSFRVTAGRAPPTQRVRRRQERKARQRHSRGAAQRSSRIARTSVGDGLEEAAMTIARGRCLTQANPRSSTSSLGILRRAVCMGTGDGMTRTPCTSHGHPARGSGTSMATSTLICTAGSGPVSLVTTIRKFYRL